MAVDARTASITGLHLGVLTTETHIDQALDTRNRRAFRLWCQRRNSQCARLQRDLLILATNGRM